jgi:hypothetical protein
MNRMAESWREFQGSVVKGKHNSRWRDDSPSPGLFIEGTAGQCGGRVSITARWRDESPSPGLFIEGAAGQCGGRGSITADGEMSHLSLASLQKELQGSAVEREA